MDDDMICRASDISLFLNSRLEGNDCDINGAASLAQVAHNKVSFISKKKFFDEPVDIKALYLISQEKKICPNSKALYIRVDDPRLAFAKVIEKFFVKKRVAAIHPTAIIDNTANVEDGVTIGAYSIIGAGVVVGKNTMIQSHVSVADNVVIGQGCIIKSGTIIGGSGFGFAFEEDKTPVRIPHIGSVIIGDAVEIGALNTIARGTLENTIIASHVKTDDHVHIAHNCIVGAKTIITACAELSGSVTLGERCWVGPNASLINGITIGDDVLIGIGAVVTEDVEDKVKLMGLSALTLRQLAKFKRGGTYGG